MAGIVLVCLLMSFLSATFLLTCNIRENHRQEQCDVYGEWEIALYEANPELMTVLDRNALVDRIGGMYLYGTVLDQASGTTAAVGYADDTALDLCRIELREGSFPKKKNEIALTREVLDHLDREYALGDEITLQMDTGESTENCVFILCGIAEDYQANIATNEKSEVVTAFLDKTFLEEKGEAASNHLFMLSDPSCDGMELQGNLLNSLKKEYDIKAENWIWNSYGYPEDDLEIEIPGMVWMVLAFLFLMTCQGLHQNAIITLDEMRLLSNMGTPRRRQMEFNGLLCGTVVVIGAAAGFIIGILLSVLGMGWYCHMTETRFTYELEWGAAGWTALLSLSLFLVMMIFTWIGMLRKKEKSYRKRVLYENPYRGDFVKWMAKRELLTDVGKKVRFVVLQCIGIIFIVLILFHLKNIISRDKVYINSKDSIYCTIGSNNTFLDSEFVKKEKLLELSQISSIGEITKIYKSVAEIENQSNDKMDDIEVYIIESNSFIWSRLEQNLDIKKDEFYDVKLGKKVLIYDPLKQLNANIKQIQVENSEINAVAISGTSIEELNKIVSFEKATVICSAEILKNCGIEFEHEYNQLLINCSNPSSTIKKQIRKIFIDRPKVLITFYDTEYHIFYNIDIFYMFFELLTLILLGVSLEISNRQKTLIVKMQDNILALEKRVELCIWLNITKITILVSNSIILFLFLRVFILEFIGCKGNETQLIQLITNSGFNILIVIVVNIFYIFLLNKNKNKKCKKVVSF